MFISLGEIIIISTLSLIILKPSEIVSIMHRIGSMVRVIMQRYRSIISEVENWWSKR